MNVVNLGECRDLLKAWNSVRSKILRGEIKGFALTILDWEDAESVYFAGFYRDQNESAAKAALRMSWELTKQADQQDHG